jgi:excisionase family DNA binding protein
MLFRQEPDGNGGYHLRPITTAQWLTAAQVGTVLGISDKSVYRMADEGKLPCCRHGIAKRFAAEDVLEYYRKSRNGE